MPISSGLSVHDDTKHKGSAKRDAVLGVAGLDGSGNILSIGPNVELARDGANKVFIAERTSGETPFELWRVGANNYYAGIKVLGVQQYLVHTGQGDESSGYARLDSQAFVNPLVMYHMVEEYSNHLGAVDNFTQVGTGGNGTANADAANHEMDLSTGITVVGHGLFESKKQWSLSTEPLVAVFLVQNIVYGVGGGRRFHIGLKDDFTDNAETEFIGFVCDTGGQWQVKTVTGGTDSTHNISAINNGDLLTIEAVTGVVRFFVNDTRVYTHSTYIPGSGIKLGASAVTYTAAATTARQLSIDMMSIRKYV